MKIAVRTTLGLALFTLTTCFQWLPSPADNELIYACPGSDLELLWSFELDDTMGETVNCIEWFVAGNKDLNKKLVAVQTHGSFLATVPFQDRVRFLQNGSIFVKNLTMADSGNYSVEVELTESFFYNSASKYIRTVTLVVFDHLQATNVLQVRQDPKPVRDPVSKEWRLQLLFGPFIFPSKPPFLVQGTGPSGLFFTDTGYKDGFFQFLLPSPVATGNYSLQIVDRNEFKECVSDNSSIMQPYTLYVDSVEARLSLLEAAVPKHIAFHAVSRQLSSNNRVLYNTDLTNSGLGFDEGSGVFTVPESGFYFFNASYKIIYSFQCQHPNIYVDGEMINNYIFSTCVSENANSNKYTFSKQFALYLKKDQKVLMKHPWSDYYFPQVSVHGMYFSGFLISADVGV